MSAMNDIDILSEVKDEELMHEMDSDLESVITIDSDDDYVPPPPTTQYDGSDIEENEESENEEENPPPPTTQYDGSDTEEDEKSDDDTVIPPPPDDDDDIKIYDSSPSGVTDKEEENAGIKVSPVTLYTGKDDEDDMNWEDEKEYNKLELNNYNNSLLDYHNTEITHNSEEIAMLAKVIRDNKNNVIDDLHRTIPILTKYEKTRVLGQRAKQIENGHTPFVRVADNIFDSSIIAIQELEQKKIPFIIRRPLPSGASEYWHLKDLEIVY